LRSAMPWLPSWRRRLYQSVDLLMPNSMAEARQLTRYFGVPSERMFVAPNGADPRFAEADPALFVNRFGIRNFVLYSGRIEPRKNQLGFLQAMNGFDVPVVILGDPVPKFADYYDACRLAAGSNVYFMPRLEHDDPLLASAYAACGCLALASWYETPGLVAIEAGMSGTPLVVTARGCAQEYFGDMAEYVEPNDRQGIRRAVIASLDRGRSSRLAEHLRDNFSWLAAARITSEGYQKVLRTSH
jgi:glycosyltransferase involved in cell wall biosynthesis